MDFKVLFVAAVVVYEVISFLLIQEYFDGLVQERRNSIANALELRLSCTNPPILCCDKLLSKVLTRVIPVAWKQHDAVTGSLAKYVYRKISNIRRTKSQTLNASRLGLQLSLRNILKPSVKWEWRCSWSSTDRRCSNYIWVINNYVAH